jgi:hypothetical protein
VPAADLLDELAGHSARAVLRVDAEVNDLDPVAGQIEEDVSHQLALGNRCQQRSSGDAILKAGVGQKAEPLLIGSMQSEHLSELFAL